MLGLRPTTGLSSLMRRNAGSSWSSAPPFSFATIARKPRPRLDEARGMPTSPLYSGRQRSAQLAGGALISWEL